MKSSISRSATASITITPVRDTLRSLKAQI